VIQEEMPGYVTLRELGSGNVVLAREHSTGELVALKFLPTELCSSPEFVSRFAAEVPTLERLRHPNIVPVRGLLQSPGQCVIITNAVDGLSLRRLLSSGPLSPEVALLVLRGCLRGLGRAQRASILHRDFKPESVLIDGAGTARLIDFGIAMPLILSGLGLAGTPAYMAPEQWIGAPVTPATDVYAASMVLFECLAGQAPFADIEGKVAMEVAHREAPVPVEAVPEPLREIVATGAAKEPGDRFPDATAFLAALEQTASRVYGAAWASGASTALVAAMAELAALFPLAGLAGVAAGAGGAAAAMVVAPTAAVGSSIGLSARGVKVLAALAAMVGITGAGLVAVHHDKHSSQPPEATLTVGPPNGSGKAGGTSGSSSKSKGHGGSSLVPVVAISPLPSAASAIGPAASPGVAATSSPGAAVGGSAPGARATAMRLGVGGSPVAGQSVPVSIGISAPGGAAPTGGVVTLSVDGQPLPGSLSVANGQAFGTMTLPTSGPHALAADYSGTPAFQPVSNKVNVTAAPAPASVSLASSTGRTSFARPVTFDAQVKPSGPGGQLPTGTVQFLDGSAPLGQPVAVDGSGHAQLASSSLAGGTHQVTARYQGDPTFAGTASAPVQTIIDPAATQLRSASGLQLSALTIRLSATLTGADGAAVFGRPVTFTAVGGQQCTASTGPGGVASCDVNLLGLGLTSLLSFTARFAGDNNLAPSSATGGLL
jgi:serine/threonine-protein kinase